MVTVMVESDQISDITGRSGCTRHMAQSITLRRHLIPIYQTHACVLLILMTIKCFYYIEKEIINLVWFVYKEDVTESREKIIEPSFRKAHNLLHVQSQFD